VQLNSAARFRLNTAINMLLAVLFLVAFVTGWVAVLLGVSSFEPHRDSSIALSVVVVGHLVLHQRALVGQVRRCLGRAVRPTPGAGVVGRRTPAPVAPPRLPDVPA
jgi:hypothetical protein